MTRGPLTLAALASAAVPGLDPVSVEGVVGRPGDAFDTAFVQDGEHRRWVIRCPRTPAAAAQLEQSAALLALLARRWAAPVPAVKGWTALAEGGRAAVHTYLTGSLLDLASVPPGPGVAAGLGRLIATLHNLDVAIYEEAGVPSYDAEAYRRRRLAELDRAAATGRVPTALLSRWEQVLEDVAVWRFAPVPTHGAIDASTVLVDTTGDQPTPKTFLGWEAAQVADPADDLAGLVSELDEEALETVLEAYAHTRVDRPDRHLLDRARLTSEMSLVRSMMAAVAAGDLDAAEEHAAALRRLDERLAAEEPAPEAGDEAPAAAPEDDATIDAPEDDAPEDDATLDAAPDGEDSTGTDGAEPDAAADDEGGSESTDVIPIRPRSDSTD